MDDYAEDNFTGSGDEVKQRRLVISIDFGTTYTGIAFATPLGSTASLYDVDIVMSWGDRMGNSDKIPSVISYSQRSKELQEANWGSDLAKQAVAMKHMKLRLDAQSVTDEIDFLLQLLDGVRDLEFQNIKDSKGMPDYTDKAPEDIVTDYLTHVFRYVLEQVDGFSAKVREEIPVDLVITIPVGWSYAAMNSTYRAVTKAGFNRITFPHLQDTMFISEPEAAAVYTARYFDEEGRQFLREDECFILVDAGGGTVDIVSYQVDSLSPLKLTPVGVPTGRRCGSIFIDAEFRQWLRHLLGDEHYLKLDPQADLNNMYGIECEAIRHIMSKFDTIKKDFHQNASKEFIDLPKPLNNLTLPGKVDLGQVTIENEDMRSFFDPCVDEIIEMVKYHIRQIDDFGSRVQNIFLIGGFGESQYLKEEMTDSLRMRDEKELRIPDTSWTAVARGAVLCGIEKSDMTNLVKTSMCPKSWGIAVDESASLANDDRDVDINPLTGKKIARNQMRWLINKGDLILSTQPTIKEHQFVVRFRENEREKKKGSVQIYAWADDKRRPVRLLNATRELQYDDLLHYDFSSCPLSNFSRRQGQGRFEHYYAAQVTLRLSIGIGETKVKAELLWKDGQPVPTTSSAPSRPVSMDRPRSDSSGAEQSNVAAAAGQPISSLAAGMSGLGFGPGAGSRDNGFGRRTDRGRLSVRDTDFQGVQQWS